MVQPTRDIYCPTDRGGGSYFIIATGRLRPDLDPAGTGGLPDRVMESRVCLLLLLALSQAPVVTGDNQVYSYVMSCQPGAPQVQLSATFNEDEMFRFDFQINRTEAMLPDFRKWEQYPFDPATIPYEVKLCQAFMKFLNASLTNTMPQARGSPVLDVYTRHPLEFGKPNTLICFISNFFPPVLNITWTRGNVLVTSGVHTTDYYPNNDLGFFVYSYLDFTPAPDDLYTCIVTQGSEKYSSIVNWLPKNPVPSDLMENVLCGLAFIIGILFIIVGIIFLVKGRKPRQID